MNSFAALDSLGRNLRYATRQLCKSPGISLIAIATLALGIGANTAVFTLAWAVILKGLPVPHPERLVQYGMDNGQPTTIGLSGPMYEALQRRQQASMGLFAWMSANADLRIGSGTQRVRIQYLSGSAFRVLEIRPYIGNFFGAEDDADRNAAGTPVVLSYNFWKQRFQGDASVIGRSFFLGDRPVTTVGVMPKGFEGLTANFNPAVYLPLSSFNLPDGQPYIKSPRGFGLYVLGRLKPGVTIGEADAELQALEPAIRREADPDGLYVNQLFKDFHLRARSGRNGISWVKEVYSRPLVLLELLVAFLLLLTCLNTALVMLARVSGRQQEYAVRSALGAGKTQLITQVLTEIVCLIVPSLAGGLLIGWGTAHKLVGMLGTLGGASSMDVHPNGIILGFNVCMCLFVTLAAGLWPAVRTARTHPALDLKASDRSVAAKHSGSWMVAAQMAVSVSLVTSAVLLNGILDRLLTRDSGLNTQGTVWASVYLPSIGSNDEERQRTVSALLQNVRQKPGVIASGFTESEPLSGFLTARKHFAIDTRGNVHSDAQVLDKTVSPGYFDAIGTRLEGGESTASTTAGSVPQCALSHNLAAQLFPGESALGRTVYSSTPGQPDGSYLDPKLG
jgi:predicted permease